MEWRTVAGYPNYEVSDTGLVRNRKFARDMVLNFDKKGVVRVTLYGGGKKRFDSVSRIMLTAFIGPPPCGMECCHNDGNWRNNNLSNLRWDTRKANAGDRVRHGTDLRGIRNPRAKLTEDDIRCIRAEPEFIGVGRMLARALDVKPSAISSIRRGYVWTHVLQHP